MIELEPADGAAVFDARPVASHQGSQHLQVHGDDRMGGGSAIRSQGRPVQQAALGERNSVSAQPVAQLEGRGDDLRQLLAFLGKPTANQVRMRQGLGVHLEHVQVLTVKLR